MDIKELDKKQLILLTLLITFVVSIATGIITVSLMNQMPKSVPQTINNVIQKTIERVTTIPSQDNNIDNTKNIKIESKSNVSSIALNNDALISIYKINKDTSSIVNENSDTEKVEPSAIGQGVIISVEGLVLVDSDILTDDITYRVTLDKIDFNATVIKKYNNGFSILKISTIKDDKIENTIDTENTDKVE